MGCLTAPFRLLGCLGLVIALAAAWVYRKQVEQVARGMIQAAGGAPPASTGRPGVRALESARAKVDSLNGWRADSVVLTASEFASLVGSGMDRELRGQLDSLQVELLEGEIRVSGRLRTAALSRELIGPLAGTLDPREPVEAVGAVRVTRPGAGEWRVRTFRIGDFPVPREMVPGLLGQALGDPRRTAVPVKVPDGVRAIRVRPGGATLYGATGS